MTSPRLAAEVISLPLYVQDTRRKYIKDAVFSSKRTSEETRAFGLSLIHI